ncbi:hypothetical protein GGQ60_000540 [Pedobacter zeae]|uniref:Uncharacterized protein n=1 Tax=Pedobacter zeae TaxID=1737356 RepID=A0A7W6K9F9_9SPHI|nr:hypothetical protein [Pedobacter zeae]
MMKSLLTSFGFTRAITEVSGVIASATLILSQKYYTLKTESYHSQDA